MTTETKTEHMFFFNGRWVARPHRCGQADEPCVTIEWQREVGDWTPTTITGKP